MKRFVIALTVCVVVAITIVSCSANKKCPAYRSQAVPAVGIR